MGTNGVSDVAKPDHAIPGVTLSERDIQRRFQVPFYNRWAGYVFDSVRPLLCQLSHLETQLCAGQIQNPSIELQRPVYVTGLARAGTSITLDVLAAHPELASHRYADYPFFFIPIWYRRFLNLASQTHYTPQERAHLDRLMVTPQSPEAFEELIWMTFFQNLHQNHTCQVLDESTTNPAFETFYRQHQRKLVASVSAKRYLAKGNYNLTRLAYLNHLYESPRFVVLVREPVAHIASLMKQHRLFHVGLKNNPEGLAYLKRVGHFEFGPLRQAIHWGDPSAVSQVHEAWQQGDEVEGWARYWAGLYGFVNNQLYTRPELAKHVLLLRYEDLCQQPEATLQQLYAFCELPTPNNMEEFVSRLSLPTYYQPTFTEAEQTRIQQITTTTASAFGYD